MSSVDPPIGELDLHLFGEGTHRRLWELLGPQMLGPGSHGPSAVRFTVWAPNASRVSVVGDWNDWSPDAVERVEVDGPTGLWTGVCPGARPGEC